MERCEKKRMLSLVLVVVVPVECVTRVDARLFERLRLRLLPPCPFPSLPK
jgi:hypothetical protein